MNKARLEVMTALVEFSWSLALLDSSVRGFDWDYEGNPIELNREHLIDVLQRYLNKELMASDVENWANLLEGREDINFESGAEDLVDETLYQLANPDLTTPLTEGLAKNLIGNLSK